MPDYEYNFNDGSTTAPWNPQRDKIKTIVIKDGVTSIGKNAFYKSGLTSVTIPNSVTTIGEFAFEFCYSLTSIAIPNSVTSIGYSAFFKCSALTYITIPNSVTSIGNLAFAYCSSLTSITIPNSVTSIGYGGFSNCNSLTSVTIPNSVTSIGELAFGGCYSLTSIAIPNSVTSIGERAFSGCSGLTSITIPNSVTSIGERAFFNCSSLTSITFEGSKRPNFENNFFEGINKSIPIYVPSISIEEYKNVLGGLGFSNIQAIPPISLKDNASYTQDSQADGVDVSYTRTFLGYWEALYLPFSLKYEDWKDDFEIAYISSVRQKDNNDDGTIDETKLEFVKLKGGSTAPNTPYIIRAKSSGEKTLSVQNTTLYKAEKNSVECSTTTAKFTFTGIYKTITSPYTLMTNKYYVIDFADHTKLSRATNVTNCPKAFQWYMTISSRNSGYAKYNEVKEVSISVLDDEEATGVEELRIMNYELPDDKLPVYDLNGRKVNENSLKPGIYVKNGRKFVIK